MTDVESWFERKYVSALDLGEDDAVITIEKVEMKHIDLEQYGREVGALGPNERVAEPHS